MPVHFETPENIHVSYEAAGLGTRFVAWFVDNLLFSVLAVFLLFVFLCSGIVTDAVVRDLMRTADESAGGGMDDFQPGQPPRFVLIVMGIWMLVWNLGSFVYFVLSELFLRGQTVGKRAMHIRVVKTDGFSLDPGSIFVRNIFRVVDQIPPLWIVPLLSAKGQRFGDMVGGTVVVSDQPAKMTTVREAISQTPAAELQFRFDRNMLDRLRNSDREAIERILERSHELSVGELDALLDQIVPALVRRLEADPPPEADRVQFLQDLLWAEYRRQDRHLG